MSKFAIFNLVMVWLCLGLTLVFTFIKLSYMSVTIKQLEAILKELNERIK